MAAPKLVRSSFNGLLEEVGRSHILMSHTLIQSVWEKRLPPMIGGLCLLKEVHEFISEVEGLAELL
jgi:hypothetical protein